MIKSEKIEFSVLLKKAQSFDQGARDELGKMYFPLIKKLATRHKYALYLKEDAVGDAAMVFTKVMDTFSGDNAQDFENYLCVAVYNFLNKKMLENYERCQMTAEENWENLCQNITYDLDESETLNVLSNNLTVRQKEIIFYKMQDLTDGEVAKKLHLARRTVVYELGKIRQSYSQNIME